MSNLKAWQTVTDGFDDDTASIVIAATRGQAVAATLASARDAGWLIVSWGDIHAKRVHKFDSLVGVLPERTPILREHAATKLQYR